MAAGIVGLVVILVGDRWFGLLLVLLSVVNVYFYANYLGDLPHYLLTTWLILAIGLAVAGEAVVQAGIDWFGARAAGAPVRGRSSSRSSLFATNWSVHDQSANHDGEKFAAEVFAALPPNAVLITYWDALTTSELRALQRGRPTRREPPRVRHATRSSPATRSRFRSTSIAEGARYSR